MTIHMTYYDVRRECTIGNRRMFGAVFYIPDDTQGNQENLSSQSKLLLSKSVREQVRKATVSESRVFVFIIHEVKKLKNRDFQ